jgi:hypothetical protein
MEYSIFLAQVVGCYAFALSLAWIVHAQRCRKTMHEFLSNPALVTISGGLSILFGLLIVLTHPVWVSDWPVVITITGWILLLQGLMRIFYPDSFVKGIKDLMAGKGLNLLCWAWLLVGAYLIWAGFFRG